MHGKIKKKGTKISTYMFRLASREKPSRGDSIIRKAVTP